MLIENLIASLDEHGSRFWEESFLANRITQFLQKNEKKSFHNWHWDDWHITASMLIVNSERTKVLLIFHKKLQRWLQFGGHSDDSGDVLSTAIREFHEESWIIDEPLIYRYSDSQTFPIFDIDIHDIPADLKWRPIHKHYDIRFLGIIPDTVSMSRQLDETDDMRWFDIDTVSDYLEEGWLLRMMEKIRQL
jgi:8-oxo-dGTP pyrophosphatase MutT (NUDIX family)